MRCHDESSARSAAGWLALLACVLVPHALAAQAPVAQAAAAPASDDAELRGTASQALFDEGRQLLEAGDYAAACAKLAESYRLDAAAGTLLNLALCHEQQGRSATAWLEYHDALSLSARANDGERKAIAAERIAALGPQLARLQLKLAADPPRDLWIALDGVRLGPPAWNTAMPIDPGHHAVTLGAAGKRTTTLDTEVTAGTQVALQLPALADAPRPRAARDEALAAPRASDRDGSRWLVAGTAFGVGGAGALLTGYFGLHAKSAWSDRNRHCEGGCDEQAVLYGKDAQRSAALATVSAVVALASTGFGIYWLLKPAREGESRARLGVQPVAAAGGALLRARGEF